LAGAVCTGRPTTTRRAAAARHDARGAATLRCRKPTFTNPAPRDLRKLIAVECDAVVEALAD